MDQGIGRPRGHGGQRREGFAEPELHAGGVAQCQPDAMAIDGVGDLRRAGRAAGRRQIEPLAPAEPGPVEQCAARRRRHRRQKIPIGLTPGDAGATADHDEIELDAALRQHLAQPIVVAPRRLRRGDEGDLGFGALDDRHQLGFAKRRVGQHHAHARLLAGQPDQKLLGGVRQMDEGDVGAHHVALEQRPRQSVRDRLDLGPAQPGRAVDQRGAIGELHRVQVTGARECQVREVAFQIADQRAPCVGRFAGKRRHGTRARQIVIARS